MNNIAIFNSSSLIIKIKQIQNIEVHGQICGRDVYVPPSYGYADM